MNGSNLCKPNYYNVDFIRHKKNKLNLRILCDKHILSLRENTTNKAQVKIAKYLNVRKL